MHLPSELEFGSFLQYSPRGTTDVSRSSKTLCLAIKNDSTIGYRPPGQDRIVVSAIKKITERIEQVRPTLPLLDVFFGPDRLLIPVPRSAPFRSSDALWPARRICEELVARGLGAAVVPALVRHTAVTKSAGAAQRPMPPDHFASTSLATQLSFSGQKKITIVDDVITRGSTLVGMSPHVVAGFPDYDIRCFALVRTMSGVEVATLEAPVIGSIEYNGGTYLHREP
jgi:hypothetical protein